LQLRQRLRKVKSRCAKFGIAKTGFQNLQKGEERKKLKIISSYLNCFYETLFLSARNFLETEKLVIYRKIDFGIGTGRIEHNYHIYASCLSINQRYNLKANHNYQMNLNVLLGADSNAKIF
jgi:hypothetical protein